MANGSVALWIGISKKRANASSIPGEPKAGLVVPHCQRTMSGILSLAFVGCELLYVPSVSEKWTTLYVP
eukprot:6087280-Pyramimonas_sp.AAC.1